MKHLKVAIIIIASLALASCTKELGGDAAIPDSGSASMDDSGVFKGWVRIKLNGDAQPLKVGAMTRGASMMSGNAELDKIAQELGAVEVQRVFAEGGKYAERRRKYGLHLWYDIRFEEELPVSRATSKFDGVAGIACVQPIYKIVLLDNEPGLPGEVVYVPASNGIIRSSQMPFNDPYLSLQWHYNNDGSMPNSVVGADANIFEAWKKETGKREVIVAVTDGGIDYNHEDLKANMWVNEAELNGQSGVDDDKNGYIDDIYGWNGASNIGTINPQSHGTHVAGTVAAVNNNGIGVGGVAGGDGTPNSGVRLMSCQAFDGGSSPSRGYADGYTYAADNGAVISQNSWGYQNSIGATPQDISEAMTYFIENAGTDKITREQTGPMKGGIMIFATGNNGVRWVAFPGAEERVLAVTAMAPDYKDGHYTSFGPESDILAPGGADGSKSPYVTANEVYSTDLNNTYSYKHGTSMACPHVSGVAALIVSHYGKDGFTPKELKERLLRAVRPLDPQNITPKRFNELGVGMVDAGMIFIENTNTKPAVPTQPQATAEKSVVTLSWIIPVDGNNLPVTAFDVAFKSKSVGKFDGQYPDDSGTLSFQNITPEGKRASFSFDGKYNTKYDFEIRSIDRFGNVSASKVDLSYAVGDYVNQKPKVLEYFEPLEISDSGEANKVTYNLAEYFTDANLFDGDMLRYEVTNRNEQCINVTIVNNNQLVIVPLSKGEANVSITAIDFDGEKALSSLMVKVLNGEYIPPVVEAGGLSLYPSPAESTLNVTVKGWNNVSASVVVYDSASRKVLNNMVALDGSGTGTLGVSKLAPGVYTLVINSDGKSFKGNFAKK